MISNTEISAFATSKYIRIGPTKINKVISQIRGKTYKEALEILIEKGADIMSPPELVPGDDYYRKSPYII
jgi:ribosomal protein L22